MAVQADVVCSHDASETIVEANKAWMGLAMTNGDPARPGDLKRDALPHRAW